MPGQFEADGFEIFTAVIPDAECDALSVELTALFDCQQSAARTRLGGIRNLLRISPRSAQVASSERLVPLVARLTGRKAFPVRAIFFDKMPESNWRVPWHQDLTIAVNQRLETPGFRGWSLKEGVVHVLPPHEILAGMVAIRVHLDDCDADNGALKAIPGSHRHGELDNDQIAEWTSRSEPAVCEVPRGGVLAMRPLLLHASPPATTPRHRRVLHIEYAADDLPNGLQWFEQS